MLLEKVRDFPMQVHIMSHDPAAETVMGTDDANQLLLAEYIHRSASDFAVACAEVDIAGREATLENTRDRLERVVDRLHALASIQRLLQPPSQARMDLANALGDLCHHYAQARFAEQGVFVQLRAADIVLDSRRGWALLMIVSELLNNAARHAFDAPGGFVKVDAVRNGDEIICLVHDDGIGMKREVVTPRMGSAIVADLARNAGIQMNAHQCPVGTMFEMRLPVHVGA